MSDILIKGMELSEFCYDCPLHNSEYGYCNILDRATIEPPRSCPLVEVKPHGRLIDADEFKASIHMNHLGKFATNRDVQVLYKLLDEAPTVLEATE